MKGSETAPPTDPTERTLWVQMQLRLKGHSFSAIARQYGWHRNVVAKAMRMPSYPQEEAIASALGLRVRKLFPERYDPRGNRLHRLRQDTAYGLRRQADR